MNQITRYRLLETIRQYAQEKLGESGEATEARNRHRDHYLPQAARLKLPDFVDGRTTELLDGATAAPSGVDSGWPLRSRARFCPSSHGWSGAVLGRRSSH